MPQHITLKVNGENYIVQAEPDTPLLYILRNDLGLKGAKFACGLGQCGACKIIMDGQAVQACKIPLHTVQNSQITTIEGVQQDGALHPIQQAFIDEQATQCGFCTGGMIIAAKSLLDRIPHPSDAEIRQAMAGNLCRCGVYDRINRAVKLASGQEPSTPVYTDVHQDSAHSDMSLSPQIPSSLVKTPDLDAWIRFNIDETVTLFTGKMEMGQDLRTSIAMIGAEELGVSLNRVRVVMADTERSPDEGYTASSMSLETSGNAMRYAAAEVRHIALTIAYEELEVPMARLIVEDGVIKDTITGKSVTYWALFSGKKIGMQFSNSVKPKSSADYKIVGSPAQRLDLLSKVTGKALFVHDFDLPGMVHARVVRPPNAGARLIDYPHQDVIAMPGMLKVVLDGSFLGVIAEREEQAVQAMAFLSYQATWESGPALPPQSTLYDDMLNQPAESCLVVDGTPTDELIPPIQVPDNSVQTKSATYIRPYHGHAALGPSAAVALMFDGKLNVWSHSQGAYPLRAGLAHILGMSECDIHVQHMDGPGCFGHNGADDAALDAALLAYNFPGRPISLKWMREDENAWEPYGPATVIKMQASLDSKGDVTSWNHDVWGFSHSSRSAGRGQSSSLLAAWYLAEPYSLPRLHPMRGPQSGVHRNAEPLYTFSGKRIVKHFLAESPLRVSAQRGLGAYANIFAMESFIDEVAISAGEDPVTFRLRYLDDERARDVINAVVEIAGHKPQDIGRGLAFAQYKNRQSYIAVIVELEVDPETGRITLIHGFIAADAGQIVNPDGLSNQIEGSFMQSASWTLKEQVTYDSQGITSLDWKGYPILRFNEAPPVKTVLLNRPGFPYLGIGEGAMGPISAAISNAVYDAAGIRLREIPFTPDKVRHALEQL